MDFKVADHKYLIKPGFLLVSYETTSVYGVTGSGVFISLWDSYKHFSGCCSYLLPNPIQKNDVSTKYGSIAIKHLIKTMKTKGSNINDLKALIIGGGDIETSFDYGKANIKIAKTILSYFNIEILSCDYGGSLGRKFIYDSENGQSLTLKTKNIRQSDWYPYLERTD